MDARSESPEGDGKTERAENALGDARESLESEGDEVAPIESRRKERFVGVFIPARV
jgi:hypothetical protein